MKALSIKICITALIYFTFFYSVIFSLNDNHEKRKSIKPGLVLTEIYPSPSTGEYSWIEFTNTSDKTVIASGIKVVIDGIIEFEINNKQLNIAPNCFLILMFDGEGLKKNWKMTNTIKNNNKKIVSELHSPPQLVNVLNSISGSIAIYNNVKPSQNNLIQYVAWGLPKHSPDNQIWDPHWFIHTKPNFGDFNPSEGLDEGYSFGLYPDAYSNNPMDWVIYSEVETSYGKKNPVPNPKMFTIPDESTIDSKNFALSWVGNFYSQGYTIQISKDKKFAKKIVNENVKTSLFQTDKIFQNGIYYYRVKTIDLMNRESTWSKTRSFNCIKMTQHKREVHLKNMKLIFQKKDTRLLCLGGCKSEQVGDNNHWDNIHQNSTNSREALDHGALNCVRASISMIVSNYNKSLSQDRIAFYSNRKRYSCKDANYTKDIGHFDGMGYPNEETNVLEWAIGSRVIRFEKKLGFDEIFNYIKSGHPIMTRIDGHMRTLFGASIGNDNFQWVYIFDPQTGLRPESYSSWEKTSAGVWVCPTDIASVREDEKSIWKDSDDDGIMDFDEIKRFETDPSEPDTDNDGVNDKNDIREYVFSSQNAYNLRSADFDHDCIRKELDPDNDNDGLLDGEEDTNGNGKFDRSAGETSNFQKNSTVKKQNDSNISKNSTTVKKEAYMAQIEGNSCIDWFGTWIWATFYWSNL